MNSLLSFLAGIISSFSPCVIILFPLVLYRFFSAENKTNKSIMQYVLFVSGFLVSYIIIGIFIQSLFSSFLVNGIKLGFGLLFVTLGFLSFFNKINPLQLPVVKNPFLVGIFFSFLVSVSPCTLPYVGILISSTSGIMVGVNMLMYGMGIILPSLVFVLLGNASFDYLRKFSKKTSKYFAHLHKGLSMILVVAGIYLLTTLHSFNAFDSYIASFMILIIFGILLQSLFIVSSHKDLLKLENILLILGLLLIVATVLVHCGSLTAHTAYEAVDDNSSATGLPVCIAESDGCIICNQCLFKFSGALILGAVGILLTYFRRSYK